MVMKTINLFISILITLFLCSCKKETEQKIILIPNGDFELWDNLNSLLYWQTNSCPACDPPFETYIVQKVTDAYNGLFAAKFIYNNVYSSFANNKFSISSHPTHLTVYIKSNITMGDTVIIHIDLFSGKNIVDNGNWYGTSSTINYEKVEIPVSQNSTSVDSALIRIVGGKKQNTELFVDNVVFFKRK
jgi:hypothetical protein